MLHKHKGKFVRVTTKDENIEIGTILDADKDWLALKCASYEKKHWYPYVDTLIIEMDNVSYVDIISPKGEKAIQEKFYLHKETEDKKEEDEKRYKRHDIEVG